MIGQTIVAVLGYGLTTVFVVLAGISLLAGLDSKSDRSLMFAGMIGCLIVALGFASTTHFMTGI